MLRRFEAPNWKASKRGGLRRRAGGAPCCPRCCNELRRWCAGRRCTERHQHRRCPATGATARRQATPHGAPPSAGGSAAAAHHIRTGASPPAHGGPRTGKKFQCTVVLAYLAMVVAHPDDIPHINPTGNGSLRPRRAQGCLQGSSAQDWPCRHATITGGLSGPFCTRRSGRCVASMSPDCRGLGARIRIGEARHPANFTPCRAGSTSPLRGPQALLSIQPLGLRGCPP